MIGDRGLTPHGARTAAQVLDFIDWHLCQTGGVSPTLIEICNGVGLAGRSNASRYLAILEEAGHIKRQASDRQCIEVVAPRYRRPDVGAIYAALGSTPIGKIGDGRKVAA